MYGFYQEEDRCATEAEADREYANYAGSVDRDRAWVLSDRDVWYANPYYTGPKVPHPEDDIYSKEDLFDFNSFEVMRKCGDLLAKQKADREAYAIVRQMHDDECPF